MKSGESIIDEMCKAKRPMVRGARGHAVGQDATTKNAFVPMRKTTGGQTENRDAMKDAPVGSLSELLPFGGYF
jgi:hypothetical protein